MAPLNAYTYPLPGLSSQPCQYTIVGLWPPVLDSWLCVHCTISLIWLLESTAGVIQRCSPLGACIPTTKVGACNIGHYVEAIKSWECSTISHWYRYPRWQYFWCRFEGKWDTVHTSVGLRQLLVFKTLMPENCGKLQNYCVNIPASDHWAFPFQRSISVESKFRSCWQLTAVWPSIGIKPTDSGLCTLTHSLPFM